MALFGLTVGAFVLANRNLGGGPTPSPPPGIVYPSPGDTASGGQGQPVDGISCESQEVLTYHVHAHVAILRDGLPLLVPRYIGITSSCIYWLHTHDDSGIIHIEAPTARNFTLKQLFDIWGYPLSANGVATYDVPGGQLTAFRDGQQWTGDPNDIELTAHTLVVLEIGKVVPPPTYDFPAGL